MQVHGPSWGSSVCLHGRSGISTAFHCSASGFPGEVSAVPGWRQRDALLLIPVSIKIWFLFSALLCSETFQAASCICRGCPPSAGFQETSRSEEEIVILHVGDICNVCVHMPVCSTIKTHISSQKELSPYPLNTTLLALPQNSTERQYIFATASHQLVCMLAMPFMASWRPALSGSLGLDIGSSVLLTWVTLTVFACDLHFVQQLASFSNWCLHIIFSNLEGKGVPSLRELRFQ